MEQKKHNKTECAVICQVANAVTQLFYIVQTVTYSTTTKLSDLQCHSMNKIPMYIKILKVAVLCSTSLVAFLFLMIYFLKKKKGLLTHSLQCSINLFTATLASVVAPPLVLNHFL
jgi:hypothetical protein